MFCLQFDGKRMNGEEYQIIILQNCDISFKLGIVKCNSGKAMDIFNSIQSMLNEYDAWSSMAMIVADTTAVNTGKQNVVVVKLQHKMSSPGFEKPQFISCQHRVLDLTIKHFILNYKA